MDPDAILRFNNILEEVTKQKEFSLDTPVNKSILKDIEDIKSRAEKPLLLFTTLERECSEIISKGGSLHSVELLKKRSIPRFHRFRTYKLPEILRKFPSLPTGPFLWQIVAEKIFLSFFKAPARTQSMQRQRCLDDIEKNAIRYASGYVLRKLMKKYSKDDSAKIKECINSLIHDPTDLDHLEDVDADDFEEYTRVWLTKTDRGGLLHVTDEAFWLFCEIEIVIYDKLMECFAGEERSVASLTATATADSDIQFIWSEINNIEDEYHHLAQCLLTSIVQEWIILRGHSLRNRFMENYKVLSMTKAKQGKKSLRKELKRNESSSKEEK